MTTAKRAPELVTSQWLNSAEPQSLKMHRGKVILVEAFQMLCPGCVSHSLPQAQRVHQAFSRDDVIVLGLHSVFEHHDAMTPVALKAFLHEYGLSFPVGVDTPVEGNPLPRTMETYGMQGTPTLLLIARDGNLAMHRFGQVSDLELGASIATLAAQSDTVQHLDRNKDAKVTSTEKDEGTGCTPEACPASED